VDQKEDDGKFPARYIYGGKKESYLFRQVEEPSEQELDVMIEQAQLNAAEEAERNNQGLGYPMVRISEE
jgi:hypothetical protein